MSLDPQCIGRIRVKRDYLLDRMEKVLHDAQVDDDMDEEMMLAFKAAGLAVVGHVSYRWQEYDTMQKLLLGIAPPIMIYTYHGIRVELLEVRL